MENRLIMAAGTLLPDQARSGAYGVKELMLALVCLVAVVAGFFLVKSLLTGPGRGSGPLRQSETDAARAGKRPYSGCRVSTTSR